MFPKNRMMKLLFVDNSVDLQQNWIDPLRRKGWGVVRARSIEDADRMMTIHNDGLEVIVVNEEYIHFAEKHDIPFVVLTKAWTERDIQKHQNSEHSAVAYVPLVGGMEALYELFQSQSSVHALKATGTDGVPVPTLASVPSPAKDISLEDYSEVLTKPEPTRTVSQLTLEAPNVVLGGEDSSLLQRPEVEEISVEESANNEGKTVILNTSQITDELRDLPLETPPEPQTGKFDLNAMGKGDSTVEAELDSGLEALPEFDSDSLESLDSMPLEMPMPNPSLAANSPLAVDANPDVVTLKNYLAMREQDVAVLTGQFRSAQERVKQLEMLLKMEKARGIEYQHMIARHENRIQNFEQEKKIEFEVIEKQVEDLKNQLLEKTDKVRNIEAKLRMTAEEVAKTKERVRVDIRRIRVREKELENQLEIHKKDSTALLQARDEKVIELKRKIDLLEFNMELIQEQYQKERSAAEELKARLKEASQVMKQAGGLLEQ